MASMPKNHIAAASALLLAFSSAIHAQTEAQLNPVTVTGANDQSMSSTNTQWGFGGAWKDKPQSITAITREQIDSQISQRVGDIISNDASVQKNYTPLGYYEFFAIRGFPLDVATAYKLNGLTVAGEASVPLENKERVEVIKGITGLEAGTLSPGGLINFVTKRPDRDLRSIGFGFGEKGSFSQFADYSQALTSDKPFGFRINAAHEDYHPYVKEATGYRNFFSLAADAKFSKETKLETDFEYQRKSQFSVPGYQLLGDNTLPPIDPFRHLTADQTWAKPVASNQINFGARLSTEINSNWKAKLGYQFSQIKTDDNLAFPWGDVTPNASWGLVNSNHFTSTGNFSIYDFRSLNELRKNEEYKFELAGKLASGGLRHNLLWGISYTTRKISQPNYLNDCAGSDGSSYCQASSVGSIYNYSSSYGNSNYAFIDFFHYTNSQKSIYLNDQISSDKYLKNFVIHLGSRFLALSENWANNYYMTTGAPQKNIWLPTLGLSYIGIQNSMQYLSYSKGLEIGTMAPLIATNYGSQLPPRITEQYEIGTKHVLNSKLQVSLAGFHISKSYEYTQQNTGYYGDYIQAGKEIHQGIEASVAGQLTNTVSLNASAMLIRTKIEGTNDLFEGKSAPNVPGFASNIFVIHRIPSFDGLSLNYTVRYIGPKYANRENSARVPGYTRFDLGITEMKKTNMGLFTVRMGIENLFDKRYWADTPEFMGDTYLIPGAPRIFRATAKLDF